MTKFKAFSSVIEKENPDMFRKLGASHGSFTSVQILPCSKLTCFISDSDFVIQVCGDDDSAFTPFFYVFRWNV